MKTFKYAALFFSCLAIGYSTAFAQPEHAIFDDKMLLDGYATKYSEEAKDTLIARMKDDQLTPYMMAAAIRVFRQKYCNEVVANEKSVIEKLLLRRLGRSDSHFVDIEVMQTLCLMDRYRYFETMVPALIQLLDHYNNAVSELAFAGINDIISTGAKKPREARIVFNTIRKILFLSRKNLASVKEPGPRLKQKIELLRWAIKILGTQELDRLPREIIDFM